MPRLYPTLRRLAVALLLLAAAAWTGRDASRSAAQIGDTVAVDAWPEPGRYPSFRLDLEPGQSHDVYLQVRSQTPTSVPVRLESEAAHAQQLQVEYLGLGVAFGALVLLLVADRYFKWQAVLPIMTPFFFIVWVTT